MKDQPTQTIEPEKDGIHILKYLPNNTVYLNLRCILTLNKTLWIGIVIYVL